jgi:hypothetical protein
MKEEHEIMPGVITNFKTVIVTRSNWVVTGKYLGKKFRSDYLERIDFENQKVYTRDNKVYSYKHIPKKKDMA